MGSREWNNVRFPFPIPHSQLLVIFPLDSRSRRVYLTIELINQEVKHSNGARSA
jgi:hypothetical protein